MVFFVASACDWPSVLKWKLLIDTQFDWNLKCLDLRKMNLSTRAYEPLILTVAALGPPSALHVFWLPLSGEWLRYAKVMAGVWKVFPWSITDTQQDSLVIYCNNFATGRSSSWRDEVSQQFTCHASKSSICIFTINEMSDSISLATSL